MWRSLMQSAWRRAKRFPILTAAIAVPACILLSVWLFNSLQTPRLSRDWVAHLAQTPRVSIEDRVFDVAKVRNWSYAAEGPVAMDYAEVQGAFDTLMGVWFAVEPFPGLEQTGHTFLLFEFEGDKLLGLTIEARREAGETYSALKGLFNQFELAYVWASARDLLARRAVFLHRQVYVYPVRLADAQQQVLLRRLLETTHRLETRPRFYNTFLSNCTNELAKHADLPWHYSFILTGLADEHLFARGVIPGERFAETRAKADVTALVQDLNDAPAAAFDAQLLAAMRARFP